MTVLFSKTVSGLTIKTLSFVAAFTPILHADPKPLFSEFKISKKFLISFIF